MYRAVNDRIQAQTQKRIQSDITFRRMKVEIVKWAAKRNLFSFYLQMAGAHGNARKESIVLQSRIESAGDSKFQI
jgi:hypothetical protein